MASNERQLSFGDFNRDWNGNWADRLARRDETRIREWYNSSVWLEEPDE